MNTIPHDDLGDLTTPLKFSERKRKLIDNLLLNLTYIQMDSCTTGGVYSMTFTLGNNRYQDPRARPQTLAIYGTLPLKYSGKDMPLNALQGHLNDIRSMCWDITGQMIASVSEDSARVWSVVVCGHCLYHMDSNGRKFQSIIFHPKYHNVLLIGGIQCMQLWILESRKVFTIPATSASIIGLAASTQNEFIASASSDSMVKIWK